ncbi:MAG: DUF1707 domain-containing protein [Actinomycetota bacterium]|nr:DUF1707 domain-containing protein [Actinomycetota bacterium]
MTESQPADLRIGDVEREDALRALGEHMGAGRLDIEEYGDRAAKVATAKTRGDLLALFGDLPEPRPRFEVPTPVIPNARQTPVPIEPGYRTPAERFWAAMIPVSAIVGVAMFVFLLRGFWPILLLPVAMTMLGGHIFGAGWQRRRREIQRYRRHHRRLGGDYH